MTDSQSGLAVELNLSPGLLIQILVYFMGGGGRNNGASEKGRNIKIIYIIPVWRYCLNYTSLSKIHRYNSLILVYHPALRASETGSGAGEVPAVRPVAAWSCAGRGWPRAGLAGRVGRGLARQTSGRTSATTRGSGGEEGRKTS